MIGHLDEAFYRNKRAAVLSSLALFAATFTSVSISKDGQVLNAFHVNSISNLTIVISAAVVCFYLNISYFLLYKTEIPEWIRDPEAGIKKIEELTSSLQAQGFEASERERILAGAFARRGEAIDLLDARLKYGDHGAPPNPAPSIEDAVANRFGKVHGPIYTGVFNEVSGGVRSGPHESMVAKNINWEEITNKVIARTSVTVSSIIEQETRRLMEAVHADIQKHIKEAQDASVNLGVVQGEVLSQLQASNQKVRLAIRGLRAWTSVMNIRLVGQFFYLPIGLFVISNIYALGSFVVGKPIHILLIGP